ncbi:MAG: PaaI family thioesterase [Nevskiales bacterium]|nr:PaaI family thioesterase [Nevskiales bacterium]
MTLELKLNAQEVEAAIREGLVMAGRGGFQVEAVEPGYARIRLPFRDSMLRPGNLVSGPTLFLAADAAMYALVLAHIGPQLMAVTTNLNMNFLSKAQPGDVIGEASMLRLGKRLAVMEVRLSTGDDPTVVAHVTGSYALPAPRS